MREADHRQPEQALQLHVSNMEGNGHGDQFFYPEDFELDALGQFVTQTDE